MSEIIERKLFLGNLFDTADNDFLNKNKIKTIICVAEGCKLNITNAEINVIQYNLQDDYTCEIDKVFDEISDIIEEHIINNNAILINCYAGVSRSATIVIAYLMKYKRMDLKSAFIWVRKQRNRVCPNSHFMECLLEYETQLFDKNSMTLSECKNLFYYT